MDTLTEKIIEADETVPELPLKDVIFRIYRDIRFSKDPTPYKVRLPLPPLRRSPVVWTGSSRKSVAPPC